MRTESKISDTFLPSTYLAVLSIVGNGAAYGYEINKIIADFGYSEWVDLRFSSIYKALRELEKRGLIRGKKSDDTLQPSKKTYQLTRKGRDVLRNQIFKCLSEPPQVKTLFDLGVSAISLLTQKEVLDALSIYKTHLEHNLKFLESNVQNFDNIDRLRRDSPKSRVGRITVEEYDNMDNLGAVRALFDRPASSIRCQISWVEAFIKLVESGNGFTFKENSKR